MKDREELIWEAVKKCKLESAFWKLTKVFPSTEGMVSVLYRRQEQEEQIQKIWCKRIGIAVLFLIAFLFLCYMAGRTSPPEKAIQNGNVIFREGEGKDITFNLSTQVDGEKKQETMSISLEDREFSREEFSKLDEKCLSLIHI